MNQLFRIERLGSSPAPTEVLKQRWPNTKKFSPELEDYVKGIIDEVELRGDDALVEFTEKFDGITLSPGDLSVGREEVERAYENVDNEQISAIEFAKQRVEALERSLLMRLNFHYEYEGLKIHHRTQPLQSVGCYVPGGGAAYPSTLIMTVVPAKVAGVRRVVVCSPPRGDDEINPLTLVAADICGADEIYRIGGAQAIAALAYGTETIRSVEKIVGPGNKYVQVAKMLVSKDVPVDMPAGPSEIAILADGTADPRIVALDMISQAEHGVDSISMLVTISNGLAEAVLEELEKSLSDIEMAVRAHLERGLVLVCEDMDGALAFINEFAPEHVEVMTEDAWKVAERITSAGLILIGDHTPVSASDYCLGTNHVLPTGGHGHVFSGLSILDFTKRVSIVESSEEGLSKVRRNVRVLAEGEGLPNHALAVEGRFRVG